MSNSKRNHRKKRPSAVASRAAAARHDRPKHEPLGAKIVAGVKRVFSWDNVRTWPEIRGQVIGGFLAVLTMVAWAFWPTLVEMVHAWNVEPDYSHGFLVLPIALYALWARRERFPGWSRGPMWAGLTLIALSVAVRSLGAKFFLGSVDGWALVVCIAGVVWTVCGTRVYWYCLPSIVFLFMAVPLPYRVERGMSLKLQGVAAKLSTWSLQLLGQPALAEGNTILLGDTQLEVEQACSGMRIFFGIFAVAFAYVVIEKRDWWETGIIAAAVVPIALIANATRIVATGLLYQFASGETARHFSHDFAGWVMIPFAALMFGLLIWYLKLAFREVYILDSKGMVQAAKK